MNIPIKVLKSNSIANEKVRNQQKVAQKYYSSVTFSAKQNKNQNESQKNLINEKNNSQNQIKNIHNIFSTSNLKEEIIRWFFSFGLNHKMVLGSIENKWLVNCIHFMYIKLKNEPNTKFSYLDGEAPECGIENYHHKLNAKQPIIFTNKKMSNNLFFHYFSTLEDSSSKKNSYTSYGMNTFTFNCGGSSLLNTNINGNNGNNNCGNKENSEFDFFNDINFYKCEESDISNDYCSYITLAEKIIENEVYFLKMFDYYSKGKAFTNFIPASWDSQAKYYTYGMPDWFAKKEAYSLQEILVAYFEQTITVKFVLFHLDPNNYNYYYTKYLKNSYIKKLKEESDPAIYNENAEGNAYNNICYMNNNNNNFAEKNSKNFINNIEVINKNENLRTNLNSKNNKSNSANNFQLNGEYSYHYNYNSILDSSPKNENKNLNYYFYNLIDPSESSENTNNNTLKDDFEKNLAAANNYENASKSFSKLNPSNNANNTSYGCNKNYSFIKSMHNVRIHLEKERSYPKGVYDIPELDCHLKKILKEKNDITTLFYSEIKSMDKLYLQSKGDKLMEEVLENKELREFLEKKSFNQQEFISFNRHSKLLKRVSFSEKKDLPFDIDLKGFITTHQSIEELLNKIIFLDIHQIFTFDDIILKRLFDNVYSIYTYKNLMELLAEEDKDSEFVEKISNNANVNANGNNNCKKKKKRKNTKKSVEKNENSEKSTNNPINISNNISDKMNLNIKNSKNDDRIICSNNYNNNDEKNSINNLENIEDIKINLNDNINDSNTQTKTNSHTDDCKIKNHEIEENLLKTKNNKDKTIYNNYINFNQDVYNNKKHENLIKNNNDNNNNKISEIYSNSENNNLDLNIHSQKLDSNDEVREIILIDNEMKTYENKQNEISQQSEKSALNAQESKLPLELKDKRKKERNKSDKTSENNVISCSKASKKGEFENNSKAAIKTLEINKDNNNKKSENKQSIKIDSKRPNSNADKNDCKKNIIKINNDCNSLKEEKKENEEQKEKITNYKQMNLKDILNLEFIPKKKIENKVNNNNKNTQIINSNNIINANENKLKNGNSNKSISLKNKTDSFASQNNDKKYDLKLSSENDKLFDKFPTSKTHLKDPSENPLSAFSDYFRENVKVANLYEMQKDSIMKSPLKLENTQLMNNLNLLSQNSLPGNSISVSDLINLSESENFKNENSQDKNENDTDTAYSSSNQSETNNYHPENIEIPSLHENSINSFEVNKINNNPNQNTNSNNNLINLKNNLQKSNVNGRKMNNDVNPNNKSGLTDVKNINNYLISPKKNHENSNLINLNLDYEFKNNFGKNKELDLIDINTKINFNKPVNNQNFTKKDSNVSLAIEKNKSILCDSKDTKDTKDNVKPENNKESEAEGKAANKIHFSLNPLANIYKLSNKNCSKECNSNEENLETKTSNEELADNNIKNNINQENKIANNCSANSYNNNNFYDACSQENYFNQTNHKNYNKNYSNYKLNSPNSIKSDKTFYNAASKNDLYSNFYGHSASFANLAYNPLYATGINPIANSYGMSTSKSFFGGFNSPNNLKSKDYNLYQNYEKKNNYSASGITANKPEINSDPGNNLDNSVGNKNKEIKEKDKENTEAQNPNSLSESNKKIKNKLKKNSTNLNISKDDLNIVKSKALNFSEGSTGASHVEGGSKKQKISKLINPTLNGNYSSSSTTNNNNNSNSSNNVPIYSNNLNLIPQAPVYQNYIPKNVNFRNFNFPVDMGNSFNLGFNHNFNNYNFFYPINMNNMGFMNMNMFGTSCTSASSTANGYYENNFYRKLHSDILEYNQKLEKNIALTKEIKSNVVKYLTQRINEILDFLNIEVHIYGSFANELSIESSDIDLIVKYEIKNNIENPYFNGIHNNTIIDIEYIISYLTSEFNEVKCMEKVNPIYTASVPIIKLVIDPAKIDDISFKKACSDNHLEISNDLKLNLNNDNEHKQNKINIDWGCEIKNKSNSVKDFESNSEYNLNESDSNVAHLKKSISERITDLRNSEIYKTYCFKKEELEKVKIDITFAEISSRNNSLTKDQTQMAVDFTKNNNKKFPEIGYIIKIIKRLLQIENLNNSFNGGLSSFTLFLLVLAFTKTFRNKSFLNNYYGLFLVEFFNFYANFDFQNYYIDVNLDMPFLAITDLAENIPLIKNPFNAYLNAAKSSYRINELKELFANVSERLNTIKNNFNNNNNNNINTENLIYSVVFKK